MKLIVEREAKPAAKRQTIKPKARVSAVGLSDGSLLSNNDFKFSAED